MTNYEISLSKEADQDFVSYVNFIKYECKSPLTALRHYEGLKILFANNTVNRFW